MWLFWSKEKGQKIRKLQKVTSNNGFIKREQKNTSNAMNERSCLCNIITGDMRVRRNHHVWNFNTHPSEDVNGVR